MILIQNHMLIQLESDIEHINTYAITKTHQQHTPKDNSIPQKLINFSKIFQFFGFNKFYKKWGPLLFHWQVKIPKPTSFPPIYIQLISQRLKLSSQTHFSANEFQNQQKGKRKEDKNPHIKTTSLECFNYRCSWTNPKNHEKESHISLQNRNPRSDVSVGRRKKKPWFE